MKDFIQKYIPFAGLLFLVVHFSLSLIYAAPEPLLPEKIQQQSRKYTLPLFEQYWSLFAPAPKINKHLFYRIDGGGWKSPTLELLAESRANRLSAAGRKQVLYSNLLYYLAEENCSCSKNKKQVVTGRETSSFHALKYLLKSNLADPAHTRMDVAVWCDAYEQPFAGKKESFMIIYPGVQL